MDRLLAPIVALATVLVVIAASTAPFLSPAFVAFEQGRADSLAWTRMSPTDLRTVTDAILTDLVTWRGDFTVELDGAPVLTAGERSHMVDVRRVFTELFAVAIAAALALVAVAVATRGRPRLRARAWRAAGTGTRALAVVIVVAGVFATVAFDAAFEVFHRLFFAAGTYDFDPRTSRLVQLFPDAFWSETAMIVGGVILVVALGIAWLAPRRARAIEAAA